MQVFIHMQPGYPGRTEVISAFLNPKDAEELYIELLQELSNDTEFDMFTTSAGKLYAFRKSGLTKETHKNPICRVYRDEYRREAVFITGTILDRPLI